ncbi:glucan binding protein-2 [Tribonema minus]|uniref:Glucan binding protein-2 n=1 Tax=Tribonema minus TaxID=303371 RepID=A0A835ZB27_9STRA|nr:glucan binding protein-2 [Tribonema minus]
MKSCTSVTVSLALLLGANAHKHGKGGNAPGETLILSDSFNLLDHDLWEHEITAGGAKGGNWEFQYFTNNRTNTFVSGGALHIQPTLTAQLFTEDGVTGVTPATLDLWGSSPADACTSNAFYGCGRSSNAIAHMSLPPVQSASLRTAESFSFRYGRVEVVAKLPRGDWIKPSISLLPARNVYGAWPSSGEITIMQSRGNAPGYAAAGDDAGGGCNVVSSLAHWGPHYSQNKWPLTIGSVAAPAGDTFADDFHTYGLFWDQDILYTYVDDDSNRVMSIAFNESASMWEKGGFEGSGMANPWEGGSAAAPFDQRFYISMSVSVGGVNGYFIDGMEGKPWTDSNGQAAMEFWNATSDWWPTWSDSALQVESVKVWQGDSGSNGGSYAAAGMYYRAAEGVSALGGAPAPSRSSSTPAGPSQASIAMVAGAIGLCVGIVATALARQANTRMLRYQEL